jgi:hypothetical protein
MKMALGIAAMAITVPITTVSPVSFSTSHGSAMKVS